MAFIPLKTFPISVTGTATAGLSLAEMYPTGALAGRQPQAVLWASGTDIVYKFSDDSASLASTTLTDHVANGGFSSDTVWTKGTGWTISAGVATASTAATALTQIPSAALVPGRAYTLVYTATRSVGTITPYVGGTLGTARTSSGTFTETIVAGSTDQLIGFNGTGFSGTVDNVSLKSTGYPDGNMVVPSGGIYTNGDPKKFISAVSLDGTSTGTLYLTLGYGDNL